MHAVIVSNGFPPTKELLKAEVASADLLIGADGGCITILKHGFAPDAVVGDLDSFEAPESPKFKVVYKPDQETNDLEKALNYAIEQGVKTCTVLGAFGRRMDHSLKNMSVLNKFHHSFNELIFRDDLFDTVLIEDTFSAKISVGNIVSLFPISGEVTGIHTEGLMYALKNENLKNGERDGTSNETITDEFSVQIEDGSLVIFFER
ncbi:MAG: thiamine diphosphokinase [Gracilimonas sp.]|uniref:thiamine diphosphokinase n=1 Tax=Gracilimonas sp. TaxID=1974203 RepID=UPI00198771D5|nr:thiamine diphosphokinase [Gracilimonas sp.]MBD3617035.1 thiamine diphosphokinase [Gracilimonas sp.]